MIHTAEGLAPLLFACVVLLVTLVVPLARRYVQAVLVDVWRFYGSIWEALMCWVHHKRLANPWDSLLPPSALVHLEQDLLFTTPQEWVRQTEYRFDHPTTVLVDPSVVTMATFAEATTNLAAAMRKVTDKVMVLPPGATYHPLDDVHHGRGAGLVHPPPMAPKSPSTGRWRVPVEMHPAGPCDLCMTVHGVRPNEATTKPLPPRTPAHAPNRAGTSQTAR